MLQILKSQAITTSTTKVLLWTVFVVFSMSNCTSKSKYHPANSQLIIVDNIFYNYRDSAKNIIQNIDYNELSANDKIYWRFFNHISRPIKEHSLDSIYFFRNHFESRQDLYHLGLTYYQEGHIEN